MKTMNFKIKNNHSHQLKNILYKNQSYQIYFDGDIYNQQQLLKQTKTSSIEEAMLHLYFEYEDHGFREMEGSFLFIIKLNDSIYIYKDLLGLYPLYYLKLNDTIYLSNKINQLLNLPHFTPCVSKKGLLQLFTLAPSTDLFDTIINGIHTLPMFHMLKIGSTMEVIQHYHLKSKPHHDDLETTCNKIHQMLVHSIHHQLQDCNACFLSGGLDSSIISAIASKFKPISTYSLEYEGNKEHFKANDYQVSLDQVFIEQMVKQYRFDHHTIQLSQDDLIKTLNQALIARGLVGMADIDSALLSLTQQLSFDHSIILSGECSDEIFGGYPWFYKKELKSNTFPWIKHFDERLSLIHERYQDLNFKDYMKKQYDYVVDQVEVLPQDKSEDYEARKQTLLVIHYFMQCLVTRQNMMGDASNMSIRAPFANIKLLEYVYNIPWKMKFLDHFEKGILRKAFEEDLPYDVLYRKKNPFPKTHHPQYANLISDLLMKRYEDPNCILHQLFDDKALFDLIKTKGDSYQSPWYGQLMSGPQLLAYLYQIDVFFTHYHIQLVA